MPCTVFYLIFLFLHINIANPTNTASVPIVIPIFPAKPVDTPINT